MSRVRAFPLDSFPEAKSLEKGFNASNMRTLEKVFETALGLPSIEGSSIFVQLALVRNIECEHFP